MEIGLFGYLVGPLIVGFLMLLGQAALQPWVAEGVRRKESILEQRYKACESAVNILQRRLASIKITGKLVPEWYTVPSEKNSPSQVEVNTMYNLLLIYCESSATAEEFYRAAVGEGGRIIPTDIPKFISAVRKELGVDKKGLANSSYHYIFIRPPTK